MKIEFLGYCTDNTMITAYKERTDSMTLKSFYNAVNQSKGDGCSCCKQGVKIYTIMVQQELPIKHEWITLCDDCIRSVPTALEVYNLYANGVPPLLKLAKENE